LFIVLLAVALAKHVTVPEHKKASLKCGEGKVIEIVNASYGVDASLDSSQEGKGNCKSKPSTLKKVKEKCQCEKGCSIMAENNVFGDPCEGTFKFLWIKYKCLSESDFEMLD